MTCSRHDTFKVSYVCYTSKVLCVFIKFQGRWSRVAIRRDRCEESCCYQTLSHFSHLSCCYQTCCYQTCCYHTSRIYHKMLSSSYHKMLSSSYHTPCSYQQSCCHLSPVLLPVGFDLLIGMPVDAGIVHRHRDCTMSHCITTKCGLASRRCLPASSLAD